MDSIIEKISFWFEAMNVQTDIEEEEGSGLIETSRDIVVIGCSTQLSSY